MARAARKWGWQQGTRGEVASEFLGTLVLITFGCGVVAMSVAALPQSGRGEVGLGSAGDWILIALGWGLAVTFGVYTAGGISGAHLNPAVTLAQAVFRDFGWRRVAPYVAAQLAGAFLGAAIVYLLYRNAIDAQEAADKISRSSEDGAATFGIFGTTPAPYFDDPFGPLVDQVIGTAFLVGLIFAVTDDENTPVRGNLAPVVVGLIVVAIGLSLGANAGYAINPARDLGPRVLALLAGWGENALPGNYAEVKAYFWVPIVGPLLGGLVGAFVYEKLIRNVLVARGATPSPSADERAETVVERT